MSRNAVRLFEKTFDVAGEQKPNLFAVARTPLSHFGAVPQYQHQHQRRHNSAYEYENIPTLGHIHIHTYSYTSILVCTFIIFVCNYTSTPRRHYIMYRTYTSIYIYTHVFVPYCRFEARTLFFALFLRFFYRIFILLISYNSNTQLFPVRRSSRNK